MAGGDGESGTEFHNYEDGGMGEGEGTKDVSDKIENEDQVINRFFFFFILQIICKISQLNLIIGLLA